MERDCVVIGIHGLANKPPADEKTRWWKAAIDEGLVRNEGIADPHFAFDFVYWADLRYDAPLSGDGNREPYRPYEGTGPLPRGETAPTLTTNAMLAPVYAGIDAVEEATGVTLVDDVILEHRFDDLWHYHAEQDFARRVRTRLIERLKAFGAHRIFLVAHSMGSVIAYDVLRMLERDEPSLRIDHLVTAASPLGLAKVKLKFEAEHDTLRVPNNVAAWTNLADGEDVVAIMGDLATDYSPNETGIRIDDRRVMNAYRRPGGEPNHHNPTATFARPNFQPSSRISFRVSNGPSGARNPSESRGDRRRSAPRVHFRSLGLCCRRRAPLSGTAPPRSRSSSAMGRLGHSRD